jgi:hypothetical protein
VARQLKLCIGSAAVKADGAQCGDATRGARGMMYWIYDYPCWEMGLLFCAVFLAVTWIGIFLMRATIHSWMHQDGRTNEMVGIALSSFFVLFGILLGLLAVATYQNYSNAGDIVDKEASSMAALYRDFSGYPQPIAGSAARICTICD